MSLSSLIDDAYDMYYDVSEQWRRVQEGRASSISHGDTLVMIIDCKHLKARIARRSGSDDDEASEAIHKLDKTVIVLQRTTSPFKRPASPSMIRSMQQSSTAVPNEADESSPTTTPDVEKSATRLLDIVLTARMNLPRGTGLPLYRPKPTDIIISTYPKAGTTLLQQMTFQIAVATGGAPPTIITGMEFSDVNDVAPWLDFAPQFGRFSCESFPRVFKTHAAYGRFRREVGGFCGVARHVVVVRDVLEYAGSWLDFMFEAMLAMESGKEDNAGNMRLAERDDIREAVFHDFVRSEIVGESRETDSSGRANRAIGGNDWFSFNASWIHDAHNDNIATLILFYDDVVTNPAETVRRLAAFMEVRQLSVEEEGRVVARCGRDFMAEGSRFECGVEGRVFGMGRVRKARSVEEGKGGFKRFQMRERDLRKVRERMREVFGVSSYGELKEWVKEREARREDMKGATMETNC